MKKLFNFIVCTTIIWTLSSCSLLEGNNSSKETGKVKTIVELPDSVKQKIVKQDAIMAELLNKVDTLTTELNSIKAECISLKKKVAELKSPKNTWAYLSIGAFILGLIALFVALFKSKGIKEEKIVDIFEECLDDSRKIKELRVDVNKLLSLQHNNKASQISSSYALNSDSRLYLLEKKMAQVIDMVSKNINPVQRPIAPCQEIPVPHRETEYQKMGYAKVDTDMYFTTIYDSNQEGCVFKITFISQTKGKFNIIALDKIQSRNDWQKKVECSGISIKDASDFRLEEEGICEKIDENTWKVIKALKIQLLK